MVGPVVLPAADHPALFVQIDARLPQDSRQLKPALGLVANGATFLVCQFGVGSLFQVLPDGIMESLGVGISICSGKQDQSDGGCEVVVCQPVGLLLQFCCPLDQVPFVIEKVVWRNFGCDVVCPPGVIRAVALAMDRRIS